MTTDTAIERAREKLWRAMREWIESDNPANSTLPEFDHLIALSRATGAVEALERCFGQDGHALYFVVRVGGLPAQPDSPRTIARRLAAQWCGRHRGVSMEDLDVSVPDWLEASRTALTRLQQEAT